MQGDPVPRAVLQWGGEAEGLSNGHLGPHSSGIQTGHPLNKKSCFFRNMYNNLYIDAHCTAGPHSEDFPLDLRANHQFWL